MPSSASVRNQVEVVLCATRTYRPARNLYQRLLNREHYAERERDRDFFRRFVQPGSLVFDIGSNNGRVAETFLELGARVVAVEANPRLAGVIRRRYGSALAVEGVAVGAQQSTAVLHVGHDEGHSTLSAEWMGNAPTGGRWSGTVEVPVTSLDALVDRHGTPDFVKIDVEGYEAEVLAGLGRAVAALSFEFQCSDLAVTESCFERLAALGDYRLNVTVGEDRDFTGPWRAPAAVLAELQALRSADGGAYGDVYAVLNRA
jgi:FkbM family methyltransferase